MVEYNFKYSSDFHYLCLQNCVSQILNHYGYKNSSYYIDCSFNFCIDPNKTAKSKIDFIHKKMNDVVIEPIKPYVKFKTIISAKNAWRINKQMLDNKKLFIAIVDVFYLNYRKEYHRIHGAHAVIVTGYNETLMSVDVIDWYEPYFYKGEIPFEELMHARASTNEKDNNPYSGWSIHNKWVEIVPSFSPIAPQECLRINMKKSLFPQDYNGKNQSLTGKDALQYILDQALMYRDNIEFWKSLHGDMFIISRSLNLFVSNFRKINIDNANFKEETEIFERYNQNFVELLYVILRNSIKTNESNFHRFKTVLYNMVEETNSLQKLFRQI